MLEKEPGYSYYAVKHNCIEEVWAWIEHNRRSHFMYKSRAAGNRWVAQIPQGRDNTMFALKYSEMVEPL